MRILFLFILGSFLSSGLFAQHHHYLFIQSDQQQAFYIKNGNEVLSSSSSGFLILPRLKDTVYSFIIGFPGEKFPSYRFHFSSYKKDRGMSLKNFEEKGWGLFDLQSLEIIMGEKVSRQEEKTEVVVKPVTQDAFTAILASVIDDPGLMGTELIGKETASYAVVRTPIKEDIPAQPNENVSAKNSPKKESEKLPAAEPPVVKTDPPVAKNETVTEEKIIKKDPANPIKSSPDADKKESPAPPPESVSSSNTTVVKTREKADSGSGIKAVVEESTLKKSMSTASARIEKLSESHKSGELILVYLDRLADGVNDTVNISIPRSEEFTAGNNREKSTGTSSSNNKPAEDAKPSVHSPGEKNTKETVADSRPPADTTSMVSRKTNNRSDCRRNATDRDIDQVRRKIIAIREEDDMVSAALREFKQKCFTTDQIKSVSFVFVTDQGKYKLLDAAYPYVFDPGNYKSLESLLNDPYYINRFKALLREN